MKKIRVYTLFTAAELAAMRRAAAAAGLSRSEWLARAARAALAADLLAADLSRSAWLAMGEVAP